MSNPSSTSRRDFLRRSAVAAAAAPLAFSPREDHRGFRRTKPPEEQPNIVFIFTDDQGYYDLGCYGNPDVDTPRMDQLAEEGIRFTNAYAPSASCTPSRSATLTGRYPQRNGLFGIIRNNMVNYDHKYTELEYTLSPEMTQSLDDREIIISQALKEGGYRNGIIGKWDSGRAQRDLPLQKGFDKFYGFANTGIDFWTHERYGIPSMYRGNNRVKEEGYATNLFRREAVDFIEENQDEPFFLYAAFNAPHNASNLDGPTYQAPDEYIQLYDDLPGSQEARYKATLKCLDDAVGAILDKLDEHGLRENTLVVFASDHGPSGSGMTGPLRSGKGTLYEGGVRIPFMARWPGKIPEGVVSDEFITCTDLFPTFLSVAGIEPPADLHLDGMNMLPVLANEEESPRDEYFWEMRGKRAARVGKWKWVVEAGSRWGSPTLEDLPAPDAKGKLFNLEEDIGEEHDVADEHPDVEREISRKWQDWMQEMVDAPDRGPFSKAYFDILGFGDGSYRL